MNNKKMNIASKIDICIDWKLNQKYHKAIIIKHHISQMQSFKEIPYQNYIQLKFNTKNLHEAERQQAMIKYKRNSQLLAEIFSLRNSQQQGNQPIVTENNITQGIIVNNKEQLAQFKQEIQTQKLKGEQECEKIKVSTQIYQEKIKSITQIKTKQELITKIQQLKQANLYDEKHPFFLEGSPFYLNPTEEEVLEVFGDDNDMQDEQDWRKMSILQL